MEGDEKRSDRFTDLLEEVRIDRTAGKEIANAYAQHLDGVLRDALRTKREFFVSIVQERLKEARLSTSPAHVEEDDRDWVGIQSLSRLRSIVGGRFQNLKKKWVDAGFPLKEHRGDQNLEHELDEAGWLELTGWISKQGYEARMSPNKTEYLFEVRKRD